MMTSTRRSHRALALALFSGSAFLFLTRSAFAATYQVGPQREIKTLDAVASLLQPGDEVQLDGDATYPGDVVFDVPGTESQKITIRGVRINGKRPVLSGGTNTLEARANHYVFEALDITGGSFRCFFHHAHDIVVRDTVIHDCPAHGLLGADQDSGNLTLEYSEVHHCGQGEQNHQIYMATDESTYPGSVFRMQYCYVHDGQGGNNVKSRAERNEIYYNWIEGAVYHDVELIGPDGQEPTLAREDSDVVGNVLRKTGDWYVVRFGGDGTGETRGRYRFVNNTVLMQPTGHAAFRLFAGIESVEMHNNVFYAGGSPVTLVAQPDADWVTGSPVIGGSNNWVPSGSEAPDSWVGTIMGAEPGFLDFASLDVRLAQGSALIDAGTLPTTSPDGHDFPSPLASPAFQPPLHQQLDPGTAQSRPAAGAIDVGAFEYGTSTGGSGGQAGSSGAGGGGQAGSSGAAGHGGGQAGAAGHAGSGQAGSAGDAGAAGSSDPAWAADDPQGCACRAANASAPSRWGWLMAIALLPLLRRKARA